MGLDMYLTATEFVSAVDWDATREREDSDRAIVKSAKWLELIKVLDIENKMWNADYGSSMSIDVPMGYWRKANQIHAWFTKGQDQDIRSYKSLEELKELRDICKQILFDPSVAKELLPPQQGFFFGSYEIDEWYLNDIKQTVEIVDNAEKSGYTFFEYYASY